MQVSYCVKEQKPCLRWVEKYFKDCLCNLKDDFSFGFGLISLVCWGVAEIPQIITNFQTKTGHGVSLAFLLTWVVGFVLFSLPSIHKHVHTFAHTHEHIKIKYFHFVSLQTKIICVCTYFLDAVMFSILWVVFWNQRR